MLRALAKIRIFTIFLLHVTRKIATVANKDAESQAYGRSTELAGWINVQLGLISCMYLTVAS